MAIDTFRGDYMFLSNFCEADVEYDGLRYPSSEAAFQALKCEDPGDRLPFTQMTPSQAKHAGRAVKLRADWNDVRLGVMEEIVRAKFTQHPALAALLLQTGDETLIEGNTWNDTFWGVSLDTGEGENHLGRILMKIRDELAHKQQAEAPQ